MMPRPFTEHKLTDAMLRRLSAICNDHAHGHGTSLVALQVRGLVVERDDAKWPKTHRATEAGTDALATARREGW